MSGIGLIFIFGPLGRGQKCQKCQKLQKLRFFSTFSARPIWLPRAMLQIIFDFLTSLGIVLGVYIRIWPNFHFWASWKGTKMSKMQKIDRTYVFFFNIFSTAYLVTKGNVTIFFWISNIIMDSFYMISMCSDFLHTRL